MNRLFCPATMCPLFASDGSPWTGHKNAACPQHDDYKNGGCAFFYNGHCDGCTGAVDQVMEVEKNGHTLQIGPIRKKREEFKPASFDCPRAAECQWQHESGDTLCPPRLALSKGIDPRTCAY